MQTLNKFFIYGFIGLGIGAAQATPTDDLFAAAKNGDLAAAKAAIKAGAKVNEAGEDQQTALHLAAENGIPAMVEFLLDHGANIESPAWDNRTPLYFCIQKIATGEGLTRRMDESLKIHSDSAETAKIRADLAKAKCEYAAKRDMYKATLQLIVTKGANVNAATKEGYTPLHIAVSCNADLVQFLVNHGADVTATARDRETPLHWTNSSDVARILIKEGANINAMSINGQTPLHYACTNPTIVQFLLDHGALINVHDQNGVTPLDNAISNAYWSNGNLEVIQILRSNGATRGTFNTGSKPPYDLEADKQNPESAN